MKRDEKVSKANANLFSVYQKRSDTAQKLVDVAERSSLREGTILTDVVKARASATQIKLPDNPTQADLDKFAAAQGQLSQSLGRLLAVSESNPTLGSTAQYGVLMTEVKNLEAQAQAARRVYIAEVAAFNVNTRTFPHNIVANVAGIQAKPQWKADDDSVRKSPTLNFGDGKKAN
jgi:LemA protein